MAEKKMAMLSVRIADETQRLLQGKAESMRLPVGAYIRHILEDHVCAPLRNVPGEANSAAAVEHSDSGEIADGAMAIDDKKAEESTKDSTVEEKAGVDAAGEAERADDGRPTYKLTYDRSFPRRWMVGPYLCCVQLYRYCGGKVELWMRIFNRKTCTDEFGNPVQRISWPISSTRRDGLEISASLSYEGAVRVINSRKFAAEERLQCHLDFSILDGAEKILDR